LSWVARSCFADIGSPEPGQPAEILLDWDASSSDEWCEGNGVMRSPGSFADLNTDLTSGTGFMITVGMNYHVLPGKQQDFEDKFAGVIDALKAAPGHTSSTLWKDVSDDASYLITSEWGDEAAFQEFIRSEAFRAVTNWGKEQILSGRPQHKVYKH
jgi:heme-degrading monooxygenase HmoA